MLSYDSELLRQPFPEKVLTGAADFRAVHDSASNPVIFIITRDGRLLLLQQTAADNVQIVDLSKRFGLLSTEKISAIAVSQANNLDLYIAFASRSGNDPSRLWLFPPTSPISTTPWHEKLDPKSAFASPATPRSLVVSKMLLGSPNPPADYPFLAVVAANVGDTKEDLYRIETSPASGSPTTSSWSWAKDLGFPFNIHGMTDYCPGTIPGATGVFGLDHTQGKPTLTFAGLASSVSSGGARAPVTVNLPIVANPKSIATTLDEDGLTNVLVGGDGILHIASQDCADGVPIGTIRSATLQDVSWTGTRKLLVAQNGRQVSLWAVNGENNLVGQQATLQLNKKSALDEILPIATPIPLLPGIETYGVVVDPRTKTQKVYCLKQDGRVSSLHQPQGSALWTEQSLRVPDTEDVQDINTYACHVKVTDDNSKALPRTSVQLQTTTPISCTVNGARLSLSPNATSVKTDSDGAISLVFPAPDLASPIVTITGPNGVAVSFSPAIKAVDKLSSAAQQGGLGKVKKPDGSLLFGNNINAKVNDAIVQIGQKYKEQVQSEMANGKSETSIATTTVVFAAVANDDHGFLWNLWHGIMSGVEKILDFSYKAGVFIIETAKKVWNFVVTTAQQALKALSGLIELIGTAIEDAVVWLAEKLDWDSITDTMAIFNEFFNTGIDLAREMIQEGGDGVDKIFEIFEKEVGSWHLPVVPPQQIASLKPKPDKEKKDEFSSSPMFNWATTQIQKEGSKDTMATAAKDSDSADFSSVLGTIYDQLFKPLWENFKDTLSSVWEDIKKLFDSKSNLTWGEVFKNLGADLILGIVRAIRKAVHGILAVSDKFLAWIKALMNKPLDIWIITKVYKRLTKGGQLTMLNLCSMILAVPTAYAFKWIYGKKPREFKPIATLLAQIKAGSRTPINEIVISNMAFTNLNTMSPRAMVPDNRLASADSRTLSTLEKTPLMQLNAVTPSASGEKSAMEWLKYLWRLGNLIKNAGCVVYSIIDTVWTGITWETLGPNAHTEEDGMWKKGPAVYIAFVITVSSVPFNKFDRNAAGITFRMLGWGACGVLNVIKAGLPDIVKPGIAGLAGVVDLVTYVIVLIAEGSGGDQPLEWTQRLLTDAWAIGSAYNAYSGGKEPWGLGITIVVGIAMNVEGIVMAKSQIEYFEKNAWKEKYYPPSFATGINGSLM